MIAESLRFVHNCVHFTAANLLFTMNNAEQKGRGLLLVVVMELEGRLCLRGGGVHVFGSVWGRTGHKSVSKLGVC